MGADWNGLSAEFRSWLHDFLALQGSTLDDAVALVSADGSHTICGAAAHHFADKPCRSCSLAAKCVFRLQLSGKCIPDDLTVAKVCLPDDVAKVYSPDDVAMPCSLLVSLRIPSTKGQAEQVGRLARIGVLVNSTWTRWQSMEHESQLRDALVNAVDALSRLATTGASHAKILSHLGETLASHCGVSGWIAVMDEPPPPPITIPNGRTVSPETVKNVLDETKASEDFKSGDWFVIPDGSVLREQLSLLWKQATNEQISPRTEVFCVPVVVSGGEDGGQHTRVWVLYAAFPEDPHPRGPQIDRIRFCAQSGLVAWDSIRRTEVAEQRVRIVRDSVRSIPGFESLVGETQAMLDLRLDILRAARSDNTVLLVGEPGTGKEVIARLIHLHSRRSQIPFLCQHVARELITIDRIAPAFFPAGLKTADVISAEYRDVPGMHGLFPPSRGKQERGRGGDAATRSEEHPAPIQDDPELATALASSEPELPSRLRPLFRILMGRLYQTWQADKFFNFFEFDSGASSSENIAPELFGAPSERFTGVAGGPGRFQTASHCGGTLFLDNIHHLPLTVQRALLKATEITHAERRVARHGAAVQEPVNTRIIVASISDLPQLVSKETFLAELMSRLMVEVIHVPPLRERRQDIPMLGAHFAGLHGKCLTDDAIEPLMASDWRDSNVRGLRCVLENAAGRVAGSHIVRRDIDLAMSALYPGSPLSVTNEEERMIRNALAENDWNVTLAARSIGWNRQKLYRAMEKYGISPDR